MNEGRVFLLLTAVVLPKNVWGLPLNPGVGERCSPIRHGAPGAFVADHNRFLTGHELLATTGPSATLCSVLCFTEPRCLSFSYLRREMQCVLHGAAEEDVPGSFSTDAAASYYHYEVAGKHGSGPAHSTVRPTQPGLSTAQKSVEPSPDLPVCSTYATGEGDMELVDEILPVDSFTLNFSVKTRAGAIMHLGRQDAEKSNYPVFVFSVIIGSSGNSTIRISSNDSVLATSPTPGILSSAEFRQFWVAYDRGRIVLGRRTGLANAIVLLESDAGTVAPGIRRAAVSSLAPNTGEWAVLGDICKDID